MDTGRFAFKESTITKMRLPYPHQFRRQMVELVHGGRTPEELAAEFEPTAQSILSMVSLAELDSSRSTC